MPHDLIGSLLIGQLKICYRTLYLMKCSFHNFVDLFILRCCWLNLKFKNKFILWVLVYPNWNDIIWIFFFVITVSIGRRFFINLSVPFRYYLLRILLARHGPLKHDLKVFILAICIVEEQLPGLVTLIQSRVQYIYWI
jgi:hypothetical protein